ncbi:precorrin-6A synthase (deacetylating) [Pelagibacterium sp. 26DY04]|uniref:precorrin-6A synthase (deacetylating) n=1 Tax=Pelagibacterium sp. 26DY04 TaxID=2967130 RepID=UPI0028156489|nr:precorrin-6A synthase (deacetylating) [Pelagibacterium sp. 26DY04]WMT88181.1 precorrin-6A synthase (deacetylating) [Pelagibacterium sp. 26DY04]
MKKLFVIGIGTGNPQHITMQGISALNQTDVVFIPTKGEEKAGLADIRMQICDRYISRAYELVEYPISPRNEATADYTQRVLDWHDLIAESYAQMFARAAADATGALLVWGDPGLYDSTLRILAAVREKAGLDFEIKVIPGITAVQALTAAFGIPLNTIGNPVTITTGRQLARGWPEGADSVVVMLDGRKSYESLDADLHIYWAAYVGMEEELLIQGRLADVRNEISKTRDSARSRHGWIMDIYLLRKAR